MNVLIVSDIHTIIDHYSTQTFNDEKSVIENITKDSLNSTNEMNVAERPQLKASVMEIIFDPIISLIKNIFIELFGDFGDNDIFNDMSKLKMGERANQSHVTICINKFNEIKGNKALFLNPFFCQLEENGENWNEAPNQNAKSGFSRLTENLNTEHFSKTDLSQPGSLRTEMENQGKHLLAMLINVGQKHWTTIHFNFQDNSINYVDSMGPFYGDLKTRCLVKERLSQAASWIQSLDEKQWQINKTDETHPCVLKHKKQFDSWSCADFVLELTNMVANENYSYSNIDSLSFIDMQSGISKRRDQMISIVKETMPKEEMKKLLKQRS